MRFTRSLWVALVAAQPVLFTGGTAQADGAPFPLPHGIHLGKNGRFFGDVCDHRFARHCLSMRMLPASYRPGALRPQAGNGYCDCGTANPCGGGSAAPPPATMTPADVVAAYKLPASAKANGKIVAIVDMPDATALSDLNVYRRAYGMAALPACTGNGGLPDPSGGTPCFAAVDENGAVTSSAGDCQANDGETGLDTEMVAAACPDCSIILVQMTGADMTNGPQDADFITSAQSAAKLGALAISMSYGGGEGGDPTGNQYTTPGHVVLAAAGDDGYEDDNVQGTSPEYPASAPDVLGVGGTTLQLSGTTYSEVVWNDGAMGGAGGSGCSTEFPLPAFQTQFLTTHPMAFGSCAMRASVDISAAAEFAPAANPQGGGIAEYDVVDGWTASVGTSAATPLVAAMLTRLGLTEQVSSNLGFIYENIAAFNDVTSGNNVLAGTCTGVMCNAGIGWDGPTGVGTPNGQKLAALGMSGGDDGGADGGSDASAGGLDGSGGSSGGIDSGSVGAGGDGGPENQDTTTKTAAGCSCRAGEASALDGLTVLALGGAVVGLASRRRRRQ